MALTKVPQSVTTAGRVCAYLTTTEHAEGPATVLVLRGEADSSTTPVLSDALTRVLVSRTGDVVIDLAGIEFMDTVTGRTLAVARQLLDLRDRRLTFRSPSRLAARVLDLFGLSYLIEAGESVSCASE